ncbi:MAG: FkbM family methyltransferase [Lentisphaerae bacterium]|nr:FkbM family methyltransferase [Lentisphaerota bacterium]
MQVILKKIRNRLSRTFRRWLVGLRLQPPTLEDYEDQVLQRVVSPGDICYDVGANIGNTAKRLARLAGPRGCVVAFEPVWPTYETMCRRLCWPGWRKAPVIPIAAGLSDAEGTFPLHVPNGNFFRSSLADSQKWSRAQSEARIESFECRLLTLDGFLRMSRFPQPALIKIDVEGAELLVLRGAREFFEAGHRPLLFLELLAAWQQAFHYAPWDLLSLLSDWGYRFLFICPTGLVEHHPSPTQPVPPEFAQGVNVLAYSLPQHSQIMTRLTALRMNPA